MQFVLIQMFDKDFGLVKQSIYQPVSSADFHWVAMLQDIENFIKHVSIKYFERKMKVHVSQPKYPDSFMNFMPFLGFILCYFMLQYLHIYSILSPF